MKIPHADRAIVDVVKLREYCLSRHHPRGRHKARVFAAALGFTADDAETLRREFLEAVRREHARFGEKDAYGQRYVLDFVIRGPKGEAAVRTTWIILPHEKVPRLTSCDVLS